MSITLGGVTMTENRIAVNRGDNDDILPAIGHDQLVPTSGTGIGNPKSMQ